MPGAVRIGRFLWALLGVLLLGAPSIAAPARVPVVGVVDFYAPTPLGVFDGFTPERFAADDVAALLARRAGDRVTVIPRSQVVRAEEALRWRGDDVLHFDRLVALGRSLGADRLVVGWITLLSVEAGGGHTVPLPDGDGNGVPTAEARVVVQVFDVAQGRLVAETRQWASAVGFVRYRLAEEVLRKALAPAVPALWGPLVAPAALRDPAYGVAVRAKVYSPPPSLSTA